MTQNVLLIVIDQFRADCLNGALADAAPLPNLQALMKDAISFSRHFTVTTPCGPSRASLLTGLYAMNHRSIRNGTPLSARHKTIGAHMRSVGYEPMLFGYTDVSIDPGYLHENDPDLRNYEGLAPGFSEMVRLRLESPGAWLGYLKRHGYQIPDNYWNLYRPVPDLQTATTQDPDGSPIRSAARYSAEHSDTAYLTNRTIETLSGLGSQNWFSLITYLRPHPPLVAPAPYNTLVDSTNVPSANRLVSLDQMIRSHPFYQAYFSEPSNVGLYIGFNGDQTCMSERHVAELRAVYLGLASEVDHHIGRILSYLRESGQYDETLIVVTADHGEMLGDHYLWGKNVPTDPALHIPLIIRDPRHPQQFGQQVAAFTESVDIAPTLLDWAGGAMVPAFNGRSLLPFLAGDKPTHWRDHVFAEAELGEPDAPTRFQRFLNLPATQANYALYRTEHHKYVHFNGGLPPMLYNLTDDPLEYKTIAQDPTHAVELQHLSSLMLDHRMTHAEHSLSRMKLTASGLFRG